MLVTLLPALLWATASGTGCEWTDCRSKVMDLFDCGLGQDATETKDCGDKTCIPFFGCSYTESQTLCCPGDCEWWDFSCNADSLSEFFEKVDEQLKAKWATLSSNIQDKLTTAAKFATLSVADLKSVGAEVLAELKSIAGMTAEQLRGIAEEVRSFNTTQLHDFLKNLAPPALAEAVGDLIGDCSEPDVENRSAEFVAKLEDPSAWGQEATWSAANVSALGCALGHLAVDKLKELSDDALASAQNLVSLGRIHLMGLKDKLVSMNSTTFKTMLAGLNKSEMLASLKEWGEDTVDWGFDKVADIRNQLVTSDAFGQVANWSSMQISELGGMLTFLPLEDLKAMADEALANITNLPRLSAAQLTGLGSKLGGMALDKVTLLLDDLDPQQLHMSMLSQCEITCESEAEEEFLRNPTMDTAEAATVAYVKRVGNKSAAAAEAFAENICSEALTDSINAAAADWDAAKTACSGAAAAGDNIVTATFSSWDLDRKSALLERLGAADALGNATGWGESALSALCSAMSAFTPGTIAMLAAESLVYSSVDSALPNLNLAMAALKWTPNLREALVTKLQDSMGSVQSWSCAQVAAARELVSGLKPEDLSHLPVEAVKGLLPSAVTAMSPEQVAAFTWDHLTNISKQVRERISAERLTGLLANRTLLLAAVCGDGLVGSSGCPPYFVDLVFSLPDKSNATLENIRAALVDMAGVFEAQLLSALSDSERPTMSDGRRLAAGTAEATWRLSFNTSQDYETASETSSVAGFVANAFGVQLAADTTTDAVVTSSTSKPCWAPEALALLLSSFSAWLACSSD